MARKHFRLRDAPKRRFGATAVRLVTSAATALATILELTVSRTGGWGISPIDSLKQSPDNDIDSLARRLGIKHSDGGTTTAADLMAARDSAYIMKRNRIALSERYVRTLRKHLKQGPRASLQPARSLGRQAVAIGLETLDLARIHEGALAALESSGGRDGIIQRAELFFTEAITPIEKTHQAALKANVRLSRLNKMLSRRTVELAASHRSLEQGMARRKTVEKALRKSAEHSEKLLKESLALQKHLQHLSHQILSAQENKRKRISRDLEDEIAQTLLGINIRLLSLKKEAASNVKGLQKEIASTQRLVDISVKSIERFARESGKHHEP